MRLLFSILVSIGILPIPKQIEIQEGYFQYPEKMKEYAIFVSEKAANEQEMADFREYMQLYDFTERKGKASLKIYVGGNRFNGTLPYGSNQCEGYRLDITNKSIIVNAATMTGAFYALQTLGQLEEDGRFQCCKIEDEPSMGYRGLMLDVARHFRSVDCICRQLDAMAAMKMNRLHIHLTDDQAWRLRLDAHPEMIRTAFRANIGLKKGCDNNYIAEPEGYVPGTVSFRDGCYGGYYSKENIRHILEYARIRHIEVIPEIEMPGHSTEVLDMHPELRCNCEQKTRRVVCPGKEETFAFYQDILSEVMELFPGRYIHIGGDEASKKNWSICPDCANRMKEENLSTVEQLQSYLIGRMGKFITANGKTVVGWDEIMQGGICDNATVMSWRGTEYGYQAIEQGHDVIFCPTNYFYLDYFQGYPAEEPMSIGGQIPLCQTWSAPIEAGEHIVGIQGNLWSEYITSDKHLEYMLYPRTFAIAEIAWSPKKLRADYPDFCRRANRFSDILRSRNYAVRDISRDEVMDEEFVPVKHLALGAKVVFNGNIYKSPEFFHRNLTDGFVGSGDMIETWSRFKGCGVFTVDLGVARQIRYIGTNCLHFRHAFYPEYVEVYVSADGKNFKKIGRKTSKVFASTPDNLLLSQDYDPTSYRVEYDKMLEQHWSQATYSFICDESEVRFVRFVVEPRPNYETMAIDELIIN